MIQNLGDKTILLSLLPNDVVTTTGLGSAVDLEDYEGEMAVVLDAEAGGASITYAVKLQESAPSGGTYTDVNTALVEKISVNTNDMKRFVKLSITVAGGTGAGAVSVVALASKKYG